MLRWYAIYQDDPQKESWAKEMAPQDAVIQRFRDAKGLGMHNGRAVIGMWLIDGASEQEEVIDIYGRESGFSPESSCVITSPWVAEPP